MGKKFAITLAVFALLGACVLGAGALAQGGSAAALPQRITAEPPCPATGCASGSCHGFDDVPEPGGVQPILFVNPHSMDVERFCRSCGLGRPEGTNEPLDHAATELELLCHLASRAAGAVDPAACAAPEANLPCGSAAAAFALPVEFFARAWVVCVVVLALGVLCLAADLGRPERVAALGMVVPLVMERFVRHSNYGSQLLFVAAFVLAGGFALRWCVVGAGAYDVARAFGQADVLAAGLM